MLARHNLLSSLEAAHGFRQDREAEVAVSRHPDLRDGERRPGEQPKRRNRLTQDEANSIPYRDHFARTAEGFGQPSHTPLPCRCRVGTLNPGDQPLSGPSGHSPPGPAPARSAIVILMAGGAHPAATRAVDGVGHSHGHET